MQAADVKISAYLITLNEGRYLDEVLSSLDGVDEIVIVDSGSTDATLSIAQKHQAKIIHQDWLGFAKQKAFAMQQCTHDWVLNLDGDEVLPPGAISVIKENIAQNPQRCFAIQRDDFFMGASMIPRKMRSFMRIYPKSRAKWRETDLVHEHIDIDLPVHKLPIVFKHYGYLTVDSMLLKNNGYASLKAQQRIAKGRPFSALRMIFIFPVMFIKIYFFNRHFLCGWRGFIRATLQSAYFFLTEAKLYEHQFMDKQAPAERQRPPHQD